MYKGEFNFKLKRMRCIGFCLLVAMSFPFVVLAQRSKVAQAQSAYAKFQLATAQKKVDEQIKELQSAREALDAAVLNKKTAEDMEAWTYRGLVYSLLSVLDGTKATDTEKDQWFSVGDQSYKKAIELKSTAKEKKVAELESVLDNTNQNLAVYLNKKAFDCYSQKKYECALENFKKTSEKLPKDSILVFYSGVLENLLKKPDEALEFLKKAESMGLKSPQLYSEYHRSYIAKKDTVSALKVLDRGRKIFPLEKNLLFDEINIYIAQRRSDLLVEKLQEAMKKDPKNKSVYAVAGNVFETVKKFDEAFESYRKALAIDPDYYVANLGCGQALVQKANEVIAQANDLPLEKEDEYKKLKEEYEAILHKAIPYLVKAYKLDSTEIALPKTLYEIYNKLQMEKEAGEMKEEIEKMGQSN